MDLILSFHKSIPLQTVKAFEKMMGGNLTKNEILYEIISMMLLTT